MSSKPTEAQQRRTLESIAMTLDASNGTVPVFSDAKDLRDELAMAAFGPALMMLSAASYEGGARPTRRDVLIEAYRWADEGMLVRRKPLDKERR